jgi:phosphatidylethanolamine-binding protein (PEBP) family uncharacterized protein
MPAAGQPPSGPGAAPPSGWTIGPASPGVVEPPEPAPPLEPPLPVAPPLPLPPVPLLPPVALLPPEPGAPASPSSPPEEEGFFPLGLPQPLPSVTTNSATRDRRIDMAQTMRRRRVADKPQSLNLGADLARRAARHGVDFRGRRHSTSPSDRNEKEVKMAMRFEALVALCVFGVACSSSGNKPAGSGGTGGQGSDDTGGSGGKATGGSPGTGGSTGGSMGSGGTGGSVAGTGGTTMPDASAETGGADGSAGDVAAKPDLTPGGPFALTSTAFMNNGVIAKKYRCQGESEGTNVSPPLSWTPGPAGTRSYAVTMRSSGSPHWALWDISPDVLSLAEKVERAPMPAIPAGSKQCKPNVDNSTWFGYAGACPMGGTNLRPYYYAVWALKVDTLPNVTPNSTIAQVNAAIMANQLAMAQLIGQAAPNSP